MEEEKLNNYSDVIAAEIEKSRLEEYLMYQNIIEEGRRKKAEWELKLFGPKVEKQPTLSKEELKDRVLKQANIYFENMAVNMQTNILIFSQWQQYYEIYIKAISANLRGFYYEKYGFLLLHSKPICITYDEIELYKLESDRLDKFLQTYGEKKQDESFELHIYAADNFNMSSIPEQPSPSKKVK